ncbi:beta-1,3-n-acetylglucosaminyltransferase radical fringe protein, putative (DUF604) [Wolffia australiana]
MASPTSKTALPTSNGSPMAAYRSFNRRRRSPGTAAAATVTIALVLATSAWSSLVFSSSDAHPWPYTSSDDGHGGSNPSPDGPLSLHHVVFGIAGSAGLWHRRREFLRLWWRAGAMRGNVWLEESPDREDLRFPPNSIPAIRVSEDISRFRYTNPTGHPSGLRIARIVAETFRLGLYGDARWFFLCDDDTIVSPENLVRVLAKYDWREMVYVGGPSESHSANTYFSHGMAFGGGGIALSFPLAKALAGMLDGCVDRYPKLYGSDDRLHACITEIGVPLSRERGFHQWDVRGNVHGLLAAHPITPFISIHHLEAVNPLYPGLGHLESLQLFSKAMNTDHSSFLQRSVCYERRSKLTFAVSLGYVVQVFPYVVLPRDLERSEITYIAWNYMGGKNEFDFDTRDSYQSLCKKPILFFLEDIWKNGSVTTGSYLRAKEKDEFKRKVLCFPRAFPLPNVKRIRVLGNRLSKNWHLAPRRLCSTISETNDELITLKVGECEKGSFGSGAGFP